MNITPEEKTPYTSVVFGSVVRAVVVAGAETNVSSHDSTASQMKAVVNSKNHAKRIREKCSIRKNSIHDPLRKRVVKGQKNMGRIRIWYRTGKRNREIVKRAASSKEMVMVNTAAMKW